MLVFPLLMLLVHEYAVQLQRFVQVEEAETDKSLKLQFVQKRYSFLYHGEGTAREIGYPCGHGTGLGRA